MKADQDDDKDQDRHDLGNGHDGVDRGGLLHATQDHEVEKPDPDRGNDDRDDGIAVTKHRKERAQGRLDQDPIRHVANAASHPISKRRQEAGIIAETCFRIGVDTSIEFRLSLRQRLKHARQRVHATAGDAPG
ncbi:hypothetical protein ABH989_002647 [Bradyrhizobium ottawaense]